MIEDMTHLEVLHNLGQEVLTLISHFNARASGKTDKKFLVELKLQENTELTALLARQSRALKYMAGLPVEPVAHEVEAVLVGVGQQGVVS